MPTSNQLLLNTIACLCQLPSCYQLSYSMLLHSSCCPAVLGSFAAALSMAGQQQQVNETSGTAAGTCHLQCCFAKVSRHDCHQLCSLNHIQANEQFTQPLAHSASSLAAQQSTLLAQHVLGWLPYTSGALTLSSGSSDAFLRNSRCLQAGKPHYCHHMSGTLLPASA